MSMNSTLCLHMILCKRSWLHAFNIRQSKQNINKKHCKLRESGSRWASSFCSVCVGGGGAVGCVGVRSWRGVGLCKCSYCYKLKLKKIYYLWKKIKTRNSCHWIFVFQLPFRKMHTVTKYIRIYISLPPIESSNGFILDRVNCFLIWNSSNIFDYHNKTYLSLMM